MYIVSLIAAQSLAAYCAFRLARTFWLMRLRADHVSKLTAYQCESMLKVLLSLFVDHRQVQIPILGGFLCEAIATYINRTITLFVVDKAPKAMPIVVAVTWSLLVRIGLNFTGCYQNPILASALTMHCAGYNFVEHVLVYWAGPVCGFIFASTVFPSVYPQLDYFLCPRWWTQRSCWCANETFTTALLRHIWLCVCCGTLLLFQASTPDDTCRCRSHRTFAPLSQ